MTNQTTPLDDELDNYTHYFRTCWECGNTWWGLHCPHDGYQNPCPECGEKPPQAIIKNPKSDTCGCEFVVPVPEAQSILKRECIKARQNELERNELGETDDLLVYRINRIAQLNQTHKEDSDE